MNVQLADGTVAQPKGKLSLESLRVESFVTTHDEVAFLGTNTCGVGTVVTCGMTCTSRTCDGAGPTCGGCQTVTICCGSCTE